MTRPRLILLIRCVALAVALWLGAEAMWLAPVALMMPPLFSSSRGGKVLFWDTDWDNAIAGNTYVSMVAVYTAMGLTVDNSSGWSGNINDYGLIIWPIAKQNPSWWSSISGGSWNGRIHITAENNNFFTDSIAYVDGISAVTGMGVNGATRDVACQWDGTAESDDLTSGQSSIQYTATSDVTGGTSLSKTYTSGTTWLARNTSGTIDFVIAGDSNHIADGCTGVVGHNTSFLQNLWSVSI